MKQIADDTTLEKFAEYLKTEKASKITCKRYVCDARKFLRFLDDNEEITPITLNRFKLLQLEKYKVNSVKTSLFGINKYLRFINCPYRIEHSDILFTNDKTEKNVLTEEEYIKVLNAIRKSGDERLFLIVQTICTSGLKLSELSFLITDSVKAEKVTISVDRIVCLPKKLCEDLADYCRDNGISYGKVFVTRNGNLPDRSNISRAIKKACGGTGIDAEKLSIKAMREFYIHNYENMRSRMADMIDMELRRKIYLEHGVERNVERKNDRR